MDTFRLKSDYSPAGDQPQAIDRLVQGIENGEKFQTLLGVTGSGKTFTMAKVIEKANRPAIILSHNKTLAAQLYMEFKEFFPDNAVEYFVSYYDYYQPEAYVPHRDLFIEKDAAINDELDRLRLAATYRLLTRRDVVIIASVSCIYGIGSPENYRNTVLLLEEGMDTEVEDIGKRLVEMQYTRNEFEFTQGVFRVKGDVLEIYPSYAVTALRVELSGKTVEKISEIDPVSKNAVNRLRRSVIYPATHYVMPGNTIERVVAQIKSELDTRLVELKKKPVEYERLKARTNYDMEMLLEMGYCTGIENYSRIIDGRTPGTPPYTLLDYFPRDYIMFVDESHATLPQVHGMQAGDHARKKNLVDYGFRLPAAYDNRPLNFDEFMAKLNQAVFVSATPDEYELDLSGKRVAEQIVRPTGLVDPAVEVRTTKGQIDDLMLEIKKRADKHERVLVTTMTKKMAESLNSFLKEKNIKSRYLHSDIETLERVQIIRELREGKFDALIGINLLREGLDIPEVSLVAILDADKEGFLRSDKSLIQTSGRAARNVNGRVIMYADTVTGSMDRAIKEMERRRNKQLKYNKEHGITPRSIIKQIKKLLTSVYEMDYYTVPLPNEEKGYQNLTAEELIKRLEEDMLREAKSLNFERAAQLRDKIADIKDGKVKVRKKRKRYDFGGED